MTEEFLKICAFILIILVLSVILRQRLAEYSVFISVAAGVIIMLTLFKNISDPINAIKYKLEQSGISENFKIALKALGIGYVSSFIADICRDSGENSLANKAIFAGKVAVFWLCVPLLISLLETAIGFI